MQGLPKIKEPVPKEACQLPKTSAGRTYQLLQFDRFAATARKNFHLENR
jgi:hypothetical protein